MRIKRLHLFLIKDYLGAFFATFFVCLFIVLMQFLWKYVDEMVGKGLEISVLFEFFGYAALSLVPMALPLAILLSSLMTFGNLGERMELIAMKAAGISLFRIMKPFLVFITLICVGAFFFSNEAMPKIQTKLYVLLRSMSQKSPEVEIPEGSFYKDIKSISIYVREKDRDSKLLKDLMIYKFPDEYSGQYGIVDKATIITADSGRLKMSDDKLNLILELYSGESFENLKETQENAKNVPYRRETFSYRQMLIDFDSNFNRTDESAASNRWTCKDLDALTYAVDSLTKRSDSINRRTTEMFVNERYFNRVAGVENLPLAELTSSLADKNQYNIDSLFSKKNTIVKKDILNYATMHANQNMEDLKNKYIEREKMIDRNTRRHDIERHRKFTLSFACLVFFFIGAPLGAIIRKGGLGVPVVISVFLFIIYYIIDNMGYKMAREGVWHVWSGMWLSSAVLFPLGIYLTYLAATDSMISININFKSLFKRKKKIDTENPNFTQTSAIDEGTEDGDESSSKDNDITTEEII